MRQVRGTRLFWGIGALVAAGWACETARNPGGVQRDVIPPTIALTTTSDTQQIASGLTFSIKAGDNLGLHDISLTYSGGYFATTDTVFTTTVTDISINKTVTFPATSGAGGLIKIVGRATDGAGNFTQDSIFIFLSNVQALKVFLLAPTTGALASSGRSIPVSVQAQQLGGIQRIGFIIVLRSAVVDSTPLPINSTDSLIFTTRQPPDTTFTDSLVVLATTGTFTVTGFAVDAGGRRGITNSVTVTVQSAANDVTPPTVSFTIASRVEVSDSITVHATDPSAISWIGFRVDTSLTLSGAPPLAFDTVNVAAGNLTDVTKTLNLGLASLITTFPTTVILRGYACDQAAARNCTYSQSSTLIVPTAPFGRPFGAAPLRAATPSGGSDTVVVVAGITRALPAGGAIADAIFDANRGELYLTNTPLSRVEIFQVANTSFVANGLATSNGSSVGGAAPWGIALWPHDTLGNYGDTIVVANSGGTEFSVLDVASRRLVWRQDLPQYLIEKYNVINVGGFFFAHITLFDVSDRPQYLGTVCRVGAAPPNCDPDSIFAVYSTTPTQSSTSPFDGKGTLRMEKLINTNALTFPADTGRLFGHLFWEIGNAGASSVTDTLRIVMRRGLPYNQTQVILSACQGVTINFATFGLGDSTFTRNSGNFTHAFVGEGGNAVPTFRRVMGYTTKQPLLHGGTAGPPPTFLPVTGTFRRCFTSPDTLKGPLDVGGNDIDFGMSPAIDVSDFISNTGVRVASIATNFNGGTNLVRADSIYYLDEGLRLKGTSPAPAGAPGMDMNYFHDFRAGQGGTPGTGGGTRDSTNRVVWAADPSGNIRLFDTFFYNQIASIPVRDPIIGPLRVAKDASGNQLLFGVTARGLVMVKLPTFPNPNPAPPRTRLMRRP